MTIHIVAEMFVTSELLWLVWVQDVQCHSNREIFFYYVLQSIIVQCQCYQVVSPQGSSYKNYHTTTTFMSSGVSDRQLWKHWSESSIGNYQTGNKTNVLWSHHILRLGLLEELKWQGHRWKFYLNEDMFIKTSFKLEILFWKLNY